jgi:hypothetical protein
LNARWHGLATPLRLEPGVDEEIERLAIAIAGARSDLMDLARRVAESELELRRVRQARMLLAKFPRPPTSEPKKGKSTNFKMRQRALRQFSRLPTEAMFEKLRRLFVEDKEYGLPNHILPGFDPNAFHRYEQRAVSKRKFAIRDFDRARLTTDSRHIKDRVF